MGDGNWEKERKEIFDELHEVSGLLRLGGTRTESGGDIQDRLGDIGAGFTGKTLPWCVEESPSLRDMLLAGCVL